MELDVINAWLGQIHQDARKLVTLNNSQLVLAEGIGLRDEINLLATMVLDGGIDPGIKKSREGRDRDRQADPATCDYGYHTLLMRWISL